MTQKIVNEATGATGDEVVMNGDRILLYLVGGLLIFFYFVITWIVRSADNDRTTRLNALPKKGYNNSKVNQD